LEEIKIHILTIENSNLVMTNIRYLFIHKKITVYIRNQKLIDKAIASFRINLLANYFRKLVENCSHPSSDSTIINSDMNFNPSRGMFVFNYYDS